MQRIPPERARSSLFFHGTKENTFARTDADGAGIYEEAHVFSKRDARVSEDIRDSLNSGLGSPPDEVVLEIENAPESIRTLLVALASKAVVKQVAFERRSALATSRTKSVQFDDHEEKLALARKKHYDFLSIYRSYSFVQSKSVVQRHQQYLKEWSKYGYLSAERMDRRYGSSLRKIECDFR
jgi:hypothetical protein